MGIFWDRGVSLEGVGGSEVMRGVVFRVELFFLTLFNNLQFK